MTTAIVLDAESQIGPDLRWPQRFTYRYEVSIR